MKEFEEYETRKLQKVLELIREDLKRNNILYTKMLEDINDDEMLYHMSRTYTNKIKNLENALNSPYFARIDFKPNDIKEAEKIYIGKTNIFDDNSNIAVVDWRAPISSIYYDGRIGKTEYECPEGIIQGELLYKRQYLIENAKLIDYNDIDITTNDQMLQNCLNENSDIRLKNIVSTIQSEQNKIIRAKMFKPLIVQGVAGSGKTTVALHRIAYLVYTYEKSFNPEDFLIIAPNKFFLDYISNVLPDLGVDYVRQQTFEEFSTEIIGDKFNVKSPNIELSKIVNEGKEKTKQIQKSAEFKSSIGFKNLIDEYLEELQENIIPKEDFNILGYVILEYNEIKNIIKESLKRNSLKKSIEILSGILQNKTANNAYELVEKITQKRKEKINKIDVSLSEETQQEVRKTIFEETEYEVSQLLKGGKKLVIDYIKTMKLEKAFLHYRKIINNKKLMCTYISEQDYDYIKEQFTKNLKKKEIEFEDLTAILYLHYKIFGLKENFSLKHIVIDEAQDFSEFQFVVLNEVLNKNKSITILGDIAQGIFNYRGTNDWNKINNIVFNNEANIERLNNSYRTTYEIMNEANKIIGKIKDENNINLAIPIARHGEPVNYLNINGFNDKVVNIEKRIKDLKEKGYINIAIITKNSEESDKLYKQLVKKNKDTIQISEDLKEYHGGTVVVPSYLSKGLEFDNVIIFDKDSYDDSVLDTKLLYVAYTRAMHTLDVYK